MNNYGYTNNKLINNFGPNETMCFLERLFIF